ncbi:RNA dependent RNA polymerase-domain-containing protein [Ochromonadaceae sp. CCMP2298]|nr:RNA dependent RNA polymerase-domain-containing protein [Ochromonadaceae sp. CCMP2298]
MQQQHQQQEPPQRFTRSQTAAAEQATVRAQPMRWAPSECLPPAALAKYTTPAPASAPASAPAPAPAPASAPASGDCNCGTDSDTGVGDVTEWLLREHFYKAALWDIYRSRRFPGQGRRRPESASFKKFEALLKIESLRDFEKRYLKALGLPRPAEQSLLSRLFVDLKQDGAPGGLASRCYHKGGCAIFTCKVELEESTAPSTPPSTSPSPSRGASGSASWRAVAELTDPVADFSTCFFFEAFGRHRFLKVALPEGTGLHSDSPSVMEEKARALEQLLSVEGVLLGGRRFRFLGGEGQGSGGHVYCFAEGVDTTGAGAGVGKGGMGVVMGCADADVDEDLPYVSVEQVRESLACFSASTDPPSKLNTRLWLGFSGTYPTLRLRDDQVQLEPDALSQQEPARNGRGAGAGTGPKAVAGSAAYATPDKPHIMSDGCGLICASLLRAAHLPYAISQGQALCPRRLPQAQGKMGQGRMGQRDAEVQVVDRDLPNTIQVRLSCGLGLFKGCLVVTDDATLCPRGRVVVRPSMLKVKGAGPSRGELGGWLLVNSTFEKGGLVGHGNCNYSQGNCNIDLSLLLCSLGAPKAYFLELVREEVRKVVEAVENGKSAYDMAERSYQRFCRQIAARSCSARDPSESDEEEGAWEGAKKEGRRGTGKEGNATAATDTDTDTAAAGEGVVDADAEEEGEGDESEPQSFQSALYTMAHYADSPAVSALGFIDAGHLVTEPQLQKHLKTLQTERLKGLRDKLKMRLALSAYIVGVPDPYGELQEGEVCVYLPLEDCMRRSNCAELEEQVLVTRYPAHHPGDVRKLRAVRRPRLCALLKGSSNAVIVFSKLGSRSEADKMSGGDFDGDAFAVMWDPDLVDAVRTVDPYCESSARQVFPGGVTKTKTKTTSSSSSTCTSSSNNKRPSDPLACALLRALYLGMVHGKVGIYSTMWRWWADVDPKSDKALRCDHLARLALDAAKAPTDLAAAAEGAQWGKKPHWCLKGKMTNTAKVTNTRRSVSVVGMAYDLVQAAMNTLGGELALPELDPDLYQVAFDSKIFFDVQAKRTAELAHRLSELWTRWSEHYRDYNCALGSLIDGKLLKRRENIIALKRKYILLFDEEAKQLYMQGSGEGGGGGGGDGGGGGMCAFRVRSQARRVLAAVVYSAVYSDCIRKFQNPFPTTPGNEKKSHSVTFVWELCSPELHENKMYSHARRTGQHENSRFAHAGMPHHCTN